MKRIILLLLSLLVFLLFYGCGGGTVQQSDSGQIETGPVFRNVNWGMTPEEVQAVETAAFDGSYKNVRCNKGLHFKLKLFDEYPCTLSYEFNDSERLIIAFYSLGVKDISNRYETYQEIMALLTEKYGRPGGVAATVACWTTSRCYISLELESDYKIVEGQIVPPGSVLIIYTSHETEERFRQERQKEHKKNKEAL